MSESSRLDDSPELLPATILDLLSALHWDSIFAEDADAQRASVPGPPR